MTILQDLRLEKIRISLISIFYKINYYKEIFILLLMSFDKNQAHYVTATGILVHNGRYLIAKRAEWEKAFPNKWTVPGGKLKAIDYVLKPKDTKDHWYNVLEDLVRREMREEVGLDMKNIGYVTSLVYIRDDEIPVLIISLYGEPVGDDVVLDKSLTEYKWVTLEEAETYNLIEGIYEEIEILDKKLRMGVQIGWGEKGY